MSIPALYIFGGVAILILLLIFMLLAKIFSALKTRQPVSAQVQAGGGAAALPKVATGVPPEVVAAIAAAVAAASGGSAVVRAIRPVQRGRGAWGFTGQQESVLPF
ncbi:MAG: OadG family transporter subunit [Oscillospiraceae bacterium]